MFPPFHEVVRHRPVDLVQPGTATTGAPYAAATGPSPELRAPGLLLRAVRQGPRVVLDVTRDGRTERLASTRHGWVRRTDELGVTVTGSLATAWSREGATWTARARSVLGGLGGAGLALAPGDGVTAAGGFGQLGLRDPRLVTEADGTPYVEGAGARHVLLSATSAGPGGFRTGHTSVWALDLDSLALTHRADLFFRLARPGGTPGRVLGHHATHLVRDGGAWRVATSSWGSFDRDRRPGVEVLAGLTWTDVTRGRHVLDVEPFPLPLDGLDSVGAWDPQLVHDGERWLVAFVSARAFFSFHPGVATGTRLDDLRLLGAATDRVSCEGPTLVRAPRGTGHLLLASDGRDEGPSRAARYPCFRLTEGGLVETGRLDAAYPTNLPWPTLVPLPDGGRLMVGFDGTPYGGGLVDYGSHGDLVLQRCAPVGPGSATRGQWPAASRAAASAAS